MKLETDSISIWKEFFFYSDYETNGISEWQKRGPVSVSWDSYNKDSNLGHFQQ